MSFIVGCQSCIFSQIASSSFSISTLQAEARSNSHCSVCCQVLIIIICCKVFSKINRFSHLEEFMLMPLETCLRRQQNKMLRKIWFQKARGQRYGEHAGVLWGKQLLHACQVNDWHGKSYNGQANMKIQKKVAANFLTNSSDHPVSFDGIADATFFWSWFPGTNSLHLYRNTCSSRRRRRRGRGWRRCKEERERGERRE